MARIDGLESSQAGLVARFVYWVTKRKFGRVMLPVKINAHHPRLLRAMGAMEMGQQAARSVDPVIKMLAQVKVAMMIGCPF
jgi:hypothetical protein